MKFTIAIVALAVLVINCIGKWVGLFGRGITIAKLSCELKIIVSGMLFCKCLCSVYRDPVIEPPESIANMVTSLAVIDARGEKDMLEISHLREKNCLSFKYLLLTQPNNLFWLDLLWFLHLKMHCIMRVLYTRPTLHRAREWEVLIRFASFRQRVSGYCACEFLCGCELRFVVVVVAVVVQVQVAYAIPVATGADWSSFGAKYTPNKLCIAYSGS